MIGAFPTAPCPSPAGHACSCSRRGPSLKPHRRIIAVRRRAPLILRASQSLDRGQADVVEGGSRLCLTLSFHSIWVRCDTAQDISISTATRCSLRRSPPGRTSFALGSRHELFDAVPF